MNPFVLVAAWFILIAVGLNYPVAACALFIACLVIAS